MKKFYSALGQLAGLITILTFAFLQLHYIIGFDFVTEQINEILNIVQLYAVYVLAGLACLELFAGKKFLMLIFLLILAFVVVMDQITSVVTG
jgi:hypothetical protein